MAQLAMGGLGERHFDGKLLAVSAAKQKVLPVSGHKVRAISVDALCLQTTPKLGSNDSCVEEEQAQLGGCTNGLELLQAIQV